MIWNVAFVFGLVWVAFVIFLVVMRVRRRRTIANANRPAMPAFDVVELHQLQASGELSPEEAARVLTVVAKQQGPSASPPPGPRGFDVLPIREK